MKMVEKEPYTVDDDIVGVFLFRSSTTAGMELRCDYCIVRTAPPRQKEKKDVKEIKSVLDNQNT